MLTILRNRNRRGSTSIGWITAALLAAAALFWLVLSLTPPPVSAAGEEIRVLSDRLEVRFPNDVLFSLEVEGEQDIVEIRLFYRVAPSGIWTYTYPDLDPSQSVEPSFNLDVSGSSYLPPGTEVEYYYSIRNSQGEIVETSREKFLYVDGRFRWQVTQAGSLSIYWHDLSGTRVKNVARQVERSLEEIEELLAVTPAGPLRGVIYNSRSEANDAFPHQSDTITQEQIFQGFAFPENKVFVGIGLQPNLIVHEAAHLLMGEAASSPKARIPAWVNEGFATYIEPGVTGYEQGFSRGSTVSRMPLRRMYAVPGTREDIRYFYLKARSVVGYLLETHGETKFREFIGHLNDGQSSAKSLSAMYEFDLDQLDQRWSSALSQDSHGDTGGGGGGSAPSFAYLDSLLIGILALLALGAMVAGFLVRRVAKKAGESSEADGLTEEEWEGRP